MSNVKERPILFSAPMVRAILDGSKTQTRRVLKNLNYRASMPEDEFTSLLRTCPYGQIGDQLWVRETFCKVNDEEFGGKIWYDYRATPRYSEIAPAGWHEESDPKDRRLKWKPSIHMPRLASRIQLGVTGVRVERLQDISRGDAMAEGCPFPNIARGQNPVRWYADLWTSINGAGSWEANPYVWIISFRRLKP